jgi:uncharacterized protein YecT (DUF1311 family)
MKLQSLVSLVFIAITSNVNASEKEYSANFTKCMNDVRTTVDSLNCIADELKVQDKRLKIVYGKLMKVESPSRRSELQSTQRLWLQYQKANCDYFDDPDGGTMAHQMSRNCLLESTKDRANELEFLFELKNLKG